MKTEVRLGVDIGGTFTDLALEVGEQRLSHKLLTTPQAPEDAVVTGVQKLIATSGIKASDISLIIHGTTLATNAIIERKGAKTALIVTDGFRDSVEEKAQVEQDLHDLFGPQQE